jgi:hypothetical protein
MNSPIQRSSYSIDEFDYTSFRANQIKTLILRSGELGGLVRATLATILYISPTTWQDEGGAKPDEQFPETVL